jgi:hypothetical protein
MKTSAKVSINIDRTRDGGLSLSAIHNNLRIQKTYYFYSVNEAKKRFKSLLN